MTGLTIRSRLVVAVGLILLAAAGTATAAAAAGSSSAAAAVVVVRPTQELAALLAPHQALSMPAPGSLPVAFVPATRPITAAQTVLPVIGHARDAAGVPWLRVRLPGRPNGLTGWIRQRATVASETGWHIVVKVSSRQVVVYRGGRVVQAFEAIVGKPSTPTPWGQAFVEEAVDLPVNAAGAPFALALSSRSTVLQEFAGGPGQTAIHGVANIGGELGTAVSHGCIRVAASTIRWLVARIGPGTPVTVRN